MSDGYARLEAEWGFTDQEREHYQYEENARYDQYDGWGDPDFNDDPGCPDCGNDASCPACKAAIADLAKFEAEYAARNDWPDDVPF